uniref:Uncharacterized protein n=1 Tax=Mycena chlorophos TaxID=658473 RepID=A0ABQ0LCH9_MYCCL|nr:predicted protein [Mycena chlorophos]
MPRPRSILLFLWAALFHVVFVHGAGSDFAWSSVSQLTTCQPASLAWDFSGSNEDLTITITNAGVAQTSPNDPNTSPVVQQTSTEQAQTTPQQAQTPTQQTQTPTQQPQSPPQVQPQTPPQVQPTGGKGGKGPGRPPGGAPPGGRPGLPMLGGFPGGSVPGGATGGAAPGGAPGGDGFRRPHIPPTRRDVSQPISATIQASSQAYSWTAVNVAEGWYTLVANLASSGATVQSNAFFVSEGTDTSCLAEHPGSSASSPARTSGSGVTGVATGATNGGPTATTSGSSLKPTGTPANGTFTGSFPAGPSHGTPFVGSALSSSKVNRGAIAGGVVGGLVFLAALTVLALYIGRARNRRNSGARRWSGVIASDGKGRPPSAHVHSESVGPILLHDNNVYMIGNVTQRAGADLEKDPAEETSDYAFSQEKLPSPPSPQDEVLFANNIGHSPTFAAIPPPEAAVVPQPVPAPSPMPPIIAPIPSPRTRTRPKSTPGPASPLMVDTFPYPPSPVPPPSPATRRSSTGEALGRRITRKAVPEYDPEDPALTPSRSITPAPISRPGSANGLAQTLNPNGAVHYLMPDMPPPQR